MNLSMTDKEVREKMKELTLQENILKKKLYDIKVKKMEIYYHEFKMTDEQISKTLDINRYTVASWRQRRGYQPYLEEKKK